MVKRRIRKKPKMQRGKQEVEFQRGGRDVGREGGGKRGRVNYRGKQRKREMEMKIYKIRKINKRKRNEK